MPRLHWETIERGVLPAVAVFAFMLGVVDDAAAWSPVFLLAGTLAGPRLVSADGDPVAGEDSAPGRPRDDGAVATRIAGDLPQGLAIHRLGRLIWYNPAFERLLGGGPLHPRLADALGDAGIADPDATAAAWEASRGPVISTTVPTGNDEPLVLRATSRDIAWNGETVRHTVLVDLGREQALETAVARLQAERDAVVRREATVLAVMSHELRTPLTSIVGFAEVMRAALHGPLGHPTYGDYLDDILASSHHLVRLMDDVLDLAHLESRALVLDDEPLVVAEILDRCLDELEDQARAAGVALVLDLDPALPDLLADERRLHQVLTNLVCNAIRLTPPGGTVSVHAFAAADDGVELHVADTGSGIEARDLHRIVNVFGLIEDPMVRRRQGIGLGLPLARLLVERHGGTLVLDSEIGAGTIAKVHFPPARSIPPDGRDDDGEAV